MKNAKRYLVLGLLLVLMAGIVYALDAPVPNYKPGKMITVRRGVAVVDSAALDTGTNLLQTAQDCGWNQVVRVICRFSNASATCKVHFARCDDTGRPVDTTSTTITADGTFTIRGKYKADSAAFDTGAFRYFKVFCEAPSAGTVDVDAQVQGSVQ